jgi:hypothetical protein
MAADRAGRRAAGLLVLASLLVLPACSTDGVDGLADTPTAATPAPPPGDVDAALPTPPPAATDDPASEQAALDAGAAAVTAFARPELTAEQWWSELQPLLTPAATEAYAGTDPAEVPARTVTGPPWRGESESSYLALTFVPTDAGDYAVLLVRDGGGAPWLVERITLVPADAASTPAGTAEEQES